MERRAKGGGGPGEEEGEKGKEGAEHEMDMKEGGEEKQARRKEEGGKG